MLNQALEEIGADPDAASADDVEFALGSLQQRMPHPAFMRLLGHCYRPGSRKPLAPPRSGGDERDGGNDDDGDGDDDEDGSDDDSRDKSPARTPKKKKNKTTETFVPSAPPCHNLKALRILQSGWSGNKSYGRKVSHPQEGLN